jgi:hypothetical protein
MGKEISQWSILLLIVISLCPDETRVVYSVGICGLVLQIKTSFLAHKKARYDNLRQKSYSNNKQAQEGTTTQARQKRSKMQNKQRGDARSGGMQRQRQLHNYFIQWCSATILRSAVVPSPHMHKTKARYHNSM